MVGIDVRLRAAKVVAMTSALLLAACQSSEEPSPSGSPPTGAGSTAAYDREERALIRQAARRVEDFETRNQSFLAAGKATERAKHFYRETVKDWRSHYARLRSHEKEGIQVARRPGMLGTEVASVKSFQDNAAEIVLRRCTDQSDLGMTRDGVPLPAAHEAPVIQEVVVLRYENRTWRIGRLTTTDTPCGS